MLYDENNNYFDIVSNELEYEYDINKYVDKNAIFQEKFRKKRHDNNFYKKSNINIIWKIIITTGDNMKILEKISNDKSGQGAAEYILLFGGVIVIAIFALTIYKSYMQTSDSNLKVKDDISEVRTTVRENNSILG